MAVIATCLGVEEQKVFIPENRVFDFILALAVIVEGIRPVNGLLLA